MLDNRRGLRPPPLSWQGGRVTEQAGPLRFLLGAVVHNEGPRLPEWFAHWQPLSDNIAVINQASTDDTAAAIAAAGIAQTFTTPIACYCEPDRNYLFKFLRDPIEPVLVIDGDEFMSREHLIVALETMQKHPNISAWFLRRKNLIDGVDASPLFQNPGDPKGYDWQLRLSRGFSLRWHEPHKYPECNGLVGYIDAEAAWLEHRRTYEQVKGRNGYRPGMPPQMLEMQAHFMENVDKLLGKGGE